MYTYITTFSNYPHVHAGNGKLLSPAHMVTNSMKQGDSGVVPIQPGEIFRF